MCIRDSFTRDTRAENRELTTMPASITISGGMVPLTGATLQAVSYTHLEVYKRQVYRLLSVVAYTVASLSS